LHVGVEMLKVALQVASDLDVFSLTARKKESMEVSQSTPAR